MKIEIKTKYKNSKAQRKALYKYVEVLLGRELREHEAISLSQFVRKVINTQNQSLIIENKRIQKAIHNLKRHYDSKIKMMSKIINYFITNKK